MRRNRIEILLVGVTILALSAGVVAGMLASRLPANAADPELIPGRATLSDELALSPEQRDHMRTIWETVRTQAQQCYRDAEDLQRQRDNELLTFLTEEQKAQFEKISRKYSGKFNETEARRQDTFNKAVDQTRTILNDQQRAKYDQILKQRFPRLPANKPR